MLLEDDTPLGVMRRKKMATRLIRLDDGILVEVIASEDDVQQVSSKQADKVQQSIEQIKPLIIKAAKTVLSAIKDLGKEASIEQVEVELGLGFEGEGNVYIATVKGQANLNVKLTLVPGESKGKD